MRYAQIQGTDLRPSVICLGAGSFGISVAQDASFELMDQFVAEGGTFLDTALVYGEWLPDGKGRSEQTIGAWIAARNNRQDVIIGTKGAHPRLATMHVPRLSRQEIVDDLDESLRNLGTDYIDLYWLHRDDRDRPVADILETVNEQITAGKIRCFGCSNWRLDRLKEAQEYAVAHGLQGFAGNQLWWSLAKPNAAAVTDSTLVQMDDAIMRYHQEQGLAAMAYTSQARGFFAKLASFEGVSEGLRKTYDNPANRERMKRLETLSTAGGESLSALALAYIVNQSFPSFPIAGCSSPEQLADNLRAGDLQLEPEQVAWLDDV